MSKFQSGLIKAGLTNIATEDLGTIASSKTKILYDYYCSSRKCAGTKDTGVYKFKTSDWIINCEDCGQRLFSKKSR